MTAQREKDKQAAMKTRARTTIEYRTGFADGADDGRKDLARRVLDELNREAFTEHQVLSRIEALCQAILKGDGA
jgi:hypothetical protein